MNLGWLGLTIMLFASVTTAQNTTTGSIATTSGGASIGGGAVQQIVGGKMPYLWSGGSDGVNYTGASVGGAVAFNGSNYIVGTDGGSNGGWMMRSTGPGDNVGFYTIPSTGSTGGKINTISPGNIESYRRMTIGPNGWVGIGTAAPSANLEVNGSLKFTTGSNGTITFGDGTVQNTAVASTQSGGTAIAGLVLNNLYINECTAAAHAYRIATLTPSTVGSADHLHLFVTLNPNWYSPYNSYIDATFANRNGFTYGYTLRGSGVGAGARLVAYQNSAGGIDIYISQTGCSTSSYSIIENQQETVYANPTDYGSTFSGTLVFDSSSASYPPATYIDDSSNFTFSGNVTLAVGKGASLTYQDGSVQTTAWNGVLGGGDYAESVDVGGDRGQYEPGDVLVIDPTDEGKFLKSASPYATAVMGIYSTRPGVVGRRQASDKSHMKDEVPMAMVGVVPTKVSAEEGPIKPGDLLVTSSTPGYAMKGSDRTRLAGAIIGKALGHLDAGKGVIEVAVAIQ